MNLLRHIEEQLSAFSDAATEATWTTDPDPALSRRLFISAAPFFAIVSVTGFVLVTVGWGHQASAATWICGTLGGFALLGACLADFLLDHRISSLPPRLPALIRVPLMSLVIFGTIALAIVLWWTGRQVLLANLAIMATLAFSISGVAAWAWLWRCGFYARNE